MRSLGVNSTKLSPVPGPSQAFVRLFSERMPRFVALSLVLHVLLLVLSSGRWESQDPDLASLENMPIEVEFIEPRRAIQVAETKLVEKSDQATPDAYLGKQTQTVSRQTRAENVAPYKDGMRASGRPEAKHRIAMDALGVRMNLQPMGNLGPGQFASTSDYLRDVPVGAETLLNTREFAFFSFYQRVRGQLEQYWEPGLRKKLKVMFDKGRRLASEKEHATKLKVILSPDGTITRVLVESTSGFLDLDQAAVEAFNKAGPFPNPPKEMVERDGTVKVEWEFVLKT